MIIKLSLGEIERARLVLRGESVIDWCRLDVAFLVYCDVTHDKYKARRMAKVKEILPRGAMVWKGKDSV